MGDRYIITGVQLGILMSDTNERTRMNILNMIMNDQMFDDVVKVKAMNEDFEVLREGK